MFYVFQESPPSDKISPLSPDKIKKIEQSLKPPYSQKAGDGDQSGASPIRKVIKKGQNIFSKYLKRQRQNVHVLYR